MKREEIKKCTIEEEVGYKTTYNSEVYLCKFNIITSKYHISSGDNEIFSFIYNFNDDIENYYIYIYLLSEYLNKIKN